MLDAVVFHVDLSCGEHHASKPEVRHYLSLYEVVFDPGRRGDYIECSNASFLMPRRAWCVFAFGLALFMPLFLLSLPSNCHSPCHAPGPTLTPKSRRDPRGGPNRIYITLLCVLAGAAFRYRPLEPCLMSICPWRAPRRFPCC